jgi:hypothetical protein
MIFLIDSLNIVLVVVAMFEAKFTTFGCEVDVSLDM